MFEHQDVLSALNGKLPLPEKIEYVHALLKDRFDFIDRISVAIYDSKTDLLKTYLHSSNDENPLVLYSAKLADSNSMKEILKVGRPRVVNDLDIFSNVSAQHTRRIASMQYKSSYTMPMFLSGEFFGFLFFNSHRKNVFDETTLHYLDMAAKSRRAESWRESGRWWHGHRSPRESARMRAPSAATRLSRL